MKTVIGVFFFITFALSSQIVKEKSLAVTIYNDNFAMVKDVRSITFERGKSDLYFTDVASSIEAETVTFKPLDSSAFIRVYEQNFEKNLIKKETLLKKYINKAIKLTIRFGSQAVIANGTLLGFDSGYILKTKNGIEIYNHVDSIQFSELPDGFFILPTLNWKVHSAQNITMDCEVAYRTKGFSWKADYSIILSQDQKVADIGGWVTIDNNSGKKYTNAKLKLIAGDVNTVSNKQNKPLYMMKTGYPASQNARSFSEKSFADYHMYTLSQEVTLNQSSKKQVEFIPKLNNVSVRKFHSLHINTGGYSQKIKLSNKISFQNSKQIGLGIPFPKGTVRVFLRDNNDGSLEFIGQDNINHTPKDQLITITTGNAFDIVASINAEQRKELSSNGRYMAKMNITITNHKETPAEIQITIGNGHNSNVNLNWKNLNEELIKLSAGLYKVVIPQIGPNQTWTAQWEQNSNP